MQGKLYGKGFVGIYEQDTRDGGYPYLKRKMTQIITKGKFDHIYQMNHQVNMEKDKHAKDFEIKDLNHGDLLVVLDAAFTDNLSLSFIDIVVNKAMKSMTFLAKIKGRAKTDPQASKEYQETLVKNIDGLVSEYITVMGDLNNFKRVFDYVVLGKKNLLDSKPNPTTLSDCSVRTFLDVFSMKLKEDDTPTCLLDYTTKKLKFLHVPSNPPGTDKDNNNEKANEISAMETARTYFDGEVMADIFKHVNRNINEHYANQSTTRKLFLSPRMILQWKRIKSKGGEAFNELKQINPTNLDPKKSFPDSFRNLRSQGSAFTDLLVPESQASGNEKKTVSEVIQCSKVNDVQFPVTDLKKRIIDYLQENKSKAMFKDASKQTLDTIKEYINSWSRNTI